MDREQEMGIVHVGVVMWAKCAVIVIRIIFQFNKIPHSFNAAVINFGNIKLISINF